MSSDFEKDISDIADIESNRIPINKNLFSYYFDLYTFFLIIIY